MDELFSITEVAEKLRVSDSTIRRLINDGELNCFKVGGQYRITQDQIEAYLKKNGNQKLKSH